MADIYEFVITMNLRDGPSDDEIADLRWHPGLGPQPERLTILTAFPVVTIDDGQPRMDDDPRPVLAQRGAAWKVGGWPSALVRGCPADGPDDHAGKDRLAGRVIRSPISAISAISTQAPVSNGSPAAIITRNRSCTVLMNGRGFPQP